MKVIIQKTLLEDLKKCMAEQNKFDLDKAAYFISLLNSLPTLFRGDEIDFMEVNLNSQMLKKVDWKAADYIGFLIKNGFVEKTRNHSSFHGKCAAYRIPEKYYYDEVVSFKIWNTSLLNKFDQKGREKSKLAMIEFCQEQRPHLVKWFDDNLSINQEDAHYEISCCLKNGNHEEYINGMQLISEWTNRAWTYSIKPHTDNRLHTTLTRTNKSLRKHLRYWGKSLVGLDLKTSQPYFLCAILKGLCLQDMEYLERIGAVEMLGEDLIGELYEVVDIDEALNFAKTVINEDLYDALAEVIPINYDSETGKPYRIVLNKKNKGEFRKKRTYESERDCMKEVVLTIFNCKKGFHSAEIKAFATAFPSIHKTIQRIKGHFEFYRLLSPIEAYCLLDCVAQEIAAKHPNMPLWSIHDSLVTTENWAIILRQEFEEGLFDLTGLKPTIEIEKWREEYK